MNRLLYPLSYAALLVRWISVLRNSTKNIIAGKMEMSSIKMENVTFSVPGYIVGGGAFDAPAVKPFDSIQLSVNSKHFQMGRRGRRPLQGVAVTRTAFRIPHNLQ